MTETRPKNRHAAALGRLNKGKTSPRKAESARLNGAKGGRPAERYRIEVQRDGQWVPAPGEASGWKRKDAERAILAGIDTVDGSPATWDAVRLVRE